MYEIVKWINILSSVILVPMGVYIGLLWGQERPKRAILFLGIYTILVVLDQLIWFSAMELMGR